MIASAGSSLATSSCAGPARRALGLDQVLEARAHEPLPLRAPGDLAGELPRGDVRAPGAPPVELRAHRHVVELPADGDERPRAHAERGHVELRAAGLLARVGRRREQRSKSSVFTFPAMNTPGRSGTGTPTSPMPTPARSIDRLSALVPEPRRGRSARCRAESVRSRARGARRAVARSARAGTARSPSAVLANGAGRSIATPVSVDSKHARPVRPRARRDRVLERHRPAHRRSAIGSSTVPRELARRRRCPGHVGVAAPSRVSELHA